MSLQAWTTMLLFYGNVGIHCDDYFLAEYNKGLNPSSSLSVPSLSVYHCAVQCVRHPKCTAASFIPETHECLKDTGGLGYPDFKINSNILLKRHGYRVVIQTPDIYWYSFVDDYNHTLRKDIVKFSIKACSNAVIGLFTEIADHGLEMYEIVIGGSNNSNSRIRRGKLTVDKVNYYESVLSCTEHRHFWMSWENGRIIVGKGEEANNTNTIIMEWIDPNPLIIRHVGVLTAWGATGEWIF